MIWSTDDPTGTEPPPAWDGATDPPAGLYYEPAPPHPLTIPGPIVIRSRWERADLHASFEELVREHERRLCRRAGLTVVQLDVRARMAGEVRR